MNHGDIKRAMRIIGGRQCLIPEYLRRRMGVALSGAGLSKHFFSFRFAGQLVVWFEVWCNNEGVIADKNKRALEVAALGFRVAFLPTYLTVRDVGQRRPCLVTPIESNLDLKLIARRLETAGYVGPNMEQAI
jgi:hypothetical protein